MNTQNKTNTNTDRPFRKGSFNNRHKKRRPKNVFRGRTPNDHDVNFNLRPSRKSNSPIEGDAVRFIALGGFEEVGKNMCAIETKNDIYIFDVGFQFTSEAESPGIDYMLPNIQYLVENKHKIKAIIITHAHLDHIGGIPFLISKLGNPPIYTRKLSALLIKKRMEEFPNIPKVTINYVETGDVIKIGDCSFEFFEVTHSIPDSMATSVKTPLGNIIISGDLKLTHIDGDPSETEKRIWGKIGSEKNILMVSDSTNCENPGWSMQETTIQKNVGDIIKNAPSRVIIATFASQFERMMSFIQSAEALGKKIVLEGYSVKVNMEIARLAKYYTPKDGTIIKVSDIDKYPADKIVIICTGGQGEEFAALPRMGRGDHKYVKLTNKDTIVLSSSVVPGNELSVRALKDVLRRHDVDLIHYKTSDIHSTGHGNAEELAWIIKQTNPTFFIPGYGYHSMLKEHRDIAINKAGMTLDNTFVIDNGTVFEMTAPDKARILPIKVPSSPIYVDGYSISDVKKTVISDRKMLAKEGFINVIVLINIGKKRLQKSPDILSRGFIYLRESQKLLVETRQIITRLATTEIEKADGGKIDVDSLKEKIHEKLETFFLQKTNKRPIIIPVVLVV